MSSDLGTLGQAKVEILASTEKYRSDIKKAEAATEKGASKMVSALDQIRLKISGIRKNVLAWKFAWGLAIASIVIGLKQSLDAVKLQAEAEAKLAATLKSTGHAAGLSAGELKRMASALQSVTTIGDEAIIPAQTLLLTFKNIGRDIFPQAIKTVLDMSAGLGQDLKSSAIQLGKALNDPITGITALSRVGVSFTAEQKNMIQTLAETNRVADAQRLILAELQSEFGGTAEAVRKTDTGALTSLKNSFGDFMEIVGGAAAAIAAPAAKSLTAAFDALNAKLSGSIDYMDRFNTRLEALRKMALDFVPVGAQAADGIIDLAEAIGDGGKVGNIGKSLDELAANFASIINPIKAMNAEFSTAAAEMTNTAKTQIAGAVVVNVKKAAESVDALNISIETLKDDLNLLFPRNDLNDLFPDPSEPIVPQEILDSYDAQFEKMFQIFEKMFQIAESTSLAMRDALAEFFFDPFDQGVKNMAESFGNAMKRMIAQALAFKTLQLASVLPGLGWLAAIGNVAKPFSAPSAAPVMSGGAAAMTAPIFNVMIDGQSIAHRVVSINQFNSRRTM